MKISILTICPEQFESFLKTPLIARNIASGLLKMEIVDIREFVKGSFRKIDDSPYGGGPGMILKAAEEHDLDVKNSFMIGDRLTDLEAGVNAGCSAVALVRTGYGETQDLPQYPGVTVIDAKNIGEAVAALVKRMD